ncbi:hypothetical protein PAMP_018606 [Pampus punctatissimus]
MPAGGTTTTTRSTTVTHWWASQRSPGCCHSEDAHYVPGEERAMHPDLQTICSDICPKS